MSEPARRLKAPIAAADWVDELLPVDLDWRTLVDRYPVACLAAAAVGGYLLGRHRGALLVGVVTAFAAEAVEANVQRLLDGA
jgi:hypothetical protein